MAHAAPRMHRDAGHGGDEEGARAGRARPVEEGGQGVEEAPPALALPAHGRGPKEKDMAHAAPRTHRDADQGGNEEAPGLAGRDSPKRGSLRSTRFRPLPPTCVVRPERQTDRAARVSVLV